MWRRASVVRGVDESARAQRRERARTEVEALIVGVAWAVWGGRGELAILAGLAGVQRVVASLAGDVGGLVAVLVLVVGVMACRPARRFVSGLLYAMRVRRAWARATIDSGVAAGPFHCPGVSSVARVPAGDLLRVRVRRGQSVASLDARAEELAACLRVRGIRMLRDPRDAAQASVLLVRRDPFEDAAPMPWPAADVAELSLWE